MRALLIIVLGMVFFSPAYADGLAKLRINVSHPAEKNKNNYFVCLANAGCFNINAGKTFLIDPGAVSNVLAADIGRGEMFNQTVPRSCQTTVGQNQTLTVSGKWVVTNSTVSIAGLHCRVS